MCKSMMMVVFALGLGCGAVTFAQENGELRERAERMREEARRVEERARAESERLREQSRQLIEQAQRSRNEGDEKPRDGEGGDDAWRDLERQIAQLNAYMAAVKARQQEFARDGQGGGESAEERMRLMMQQGAERMEKLQARRQAMLAARKQPAPMKPGPAGGDDRARRLKHMRVAAENLRAAGMNDVAQAVMSKADEFEREIREAREREGAQRPPQGAGMGRGEVEAMRRELQQLREEVRRLRAGPQGGGPGRGDRGERPDRPERPERPEGEGRPERPVRPELPQPERPQ